MYYSIFLLLYNIHYLIPSADVFRPLQSLDKQSSPPEGRYFLLVAL